MTDITYTVKDSKLKKSLMNGFDLAEDGKITLSAGTDYHLIIVSPIDGEELNASWGRLLFLHDIPEDFVYYTYVLASNIRYDFTELNTSEKLRNMNADVFINQDDILLYDIKGRFLYVAIEVVGEGEGDISDICIDRVGDNFMNTFPEIFREENGFFHRYMSIFSSIYNDFEDDIKRLPEILNIDTAPVEFLITFGKWLGIDIDCDIKDESVMRSLVRDAYELNKLKGTKAAVNKIANIMLGEDVTVLEKNIMEQFEDEAELEQFKTLFGENVYNVCILMDKRVSESQKSQFMYVLRQFVPIRARIQLVNLKKEGELDFHSYLDMNAKLFESRDGLLDSEMALDHAVVLKE